MSVGAAIRVHGFPAEAAGGFVSVHAANTHLLSCGLPARLTRTSWVSPRTDAVAL